MMLALAHVMPSSALQMGSAASTSTSIRGAVHMTQPWLTRRSVVKYDVEKAVPEAAITGALEAAMLAPNHFLNEPWRFYQAGPETIAKLCALNEEKAAMFKGVPGWMIVTIAASEYGEDGSISTKKGLEDHAATACAIQNFMISLADGGVGSKWMTGALGVAPEAVMGVVGADTDSERFMGAIWYGYPAKDLADAKAPPRKLGMKMHTKLA